MGGSIMMHYFLQQQTPAWKEKHIRALVSVAGVWGGTARALKVFAVGDNLDSWFLNSKNLLWERTNPSLAWLMPQQGFWADDEVLVETEKKNFSRSNIGEFFDGYKEHNMAMMVEDTKGLLGGLPPPQVEVFCIHGSQVNTTERVIYPPGSFPPSSLAAQQRSKPTTSNKSKNLKFWPFSTEPSLVKGDGDGTVNIRSLKGCLKWEGAQKQAVNHVDMLRRAEPTSYVVDIIDGLNKQLQRTESTQVRLQMGFSEKMVKMVVRESLLVLMSNLTNNRVMLRRMTAKTLTMVSFQSLRCLVERNSKERENIMKWMEEQT